MLQEEEMPSTSCRQRQTCQTREEVRLGSSDHMGAACCKSCYQRCWQTFIVTSQASKGGA